MSRSQASIIAVLLGFVVLVCIGAVIVLFIPIENITPAPTNTATPLPPTASPTATIQNFLPTPNPATATIIPSPTNTRLPTLTPTPFRTDTPTPDIDLNFPPPRSTATPTPPAPDPALPPTVTSTPNNPGSTPFPLNYRILFNARNPNIRKGDCTFLEWRVEGAVSAQLDGRGVPISGREEVCPERTVTYQMTIVVFDGQIDRQSVTVFVRE